MPVRDGLNLKTASAEGIFFGGGNLVGKSCLTLETLWTVACQAPLSTGFSRQEYWSGLPFPTPGDLPNQGIEPVPLALQVESLPLGHLMQRTDSVEKTRC